MSANKSFATAIECMDGRPQDAVADFARKRFGVEYVDTITGAGIAGQIAKGQTKELWEETKNKINISFFKHNSKGIVISGHEDCAGDAVAEEQQKENIKKAADKLKQMGGEIEVVPVFVKLKPLKIEIL